MVEHTLIGILDQVKRISALGGMKTVSVKVPTFDTYMNPLIQALKQLGGSGTVLEIEAKTAEIAGLTDEQLSVLQDPTKGSQTKFGYRLAWTRTYLKKYGVIENPSHAVWALSPTGIKTDTVDPAEVKRFVRAQMPETPRERTQPEPGAGEGADWRNELQSVLRQMSPSGFERLTQRILRGSGFIQVEVTGRTGDGGVDGRGIMQLGGMLSFRVIFQCKRYQGSVGAGQIRDFRGAMVGRAEKGLFITTGIFTQDARREATRDGAPPIDLVDGEQLIDILKNLELGVHSKKVEIEEVTVDKGWFNGI